MKILKSWLQKHIEETLPSDEIIEQALILKSSEVEGVEEIKLGGESLKGGNIGKDETVKEDTVFDIKVLPDRAHYMLSHRGIAYDLCAVLNLTLKPLKLGLPEKANIAGQAGVVSVKVETDLCNRYSATLITNIDNKPSPEWLKNDLEAIGSRSISGIVDATNYAMYDTGQPLHAFDADKVVGGITVRMANDGEEIELLPERVFVEGVWQEKERKLKLTSLDMVIADEKSPLAIAGVKGGLRAVVTESTKNIILESASFNPSSVRKTSTKYNIRNDSSKRYENEITSKLTENGVSCFLNIIEKVSLNCKIGMMTDVYKKLPEPWTVSVTHKNIESILNFNISEKRVVEILEKLGCKVELIKTETISYKVIPPFERLDLIIPEDIIDEVGRIEGLDKVKSILPNAKNNHEFSKGFLMAEKIKDFFITNSFTEIQTRSFSSKGDIEVAHPMASDKAFLRTSLLTGVSDSMNLAIAQAPILGLEKIQIFEIGKTFPASGEQLDLCFGIHYVKKIKNRAEVIKKETSDLISKLENELGIKFDSNNVKNYESTGGYGYVTNLENLDLNLSFDSISKELGSRNIFKSFSNEPFMTRDIALFVESSINADEVQNIIKTSASSVANDLLVKGPDLFDQFEKEGKKSLAFHLIFQANNRTLTDTEVNGFMDKVYGAVKEKGWQVR